MSDVKGKTGAVLRETAVLTGAVAIIAAGVFFFLILCYTGIKFKLPGEHDEQTRLSDYGAQPF